MEYMSVVLYCLTYYGVHTCSKQQQQQQPATAASKQTGASWPSLSVTAAAAAVKKEESTDNYIFVHCILKHAKCFRPYFKLVVCPCDGLIIVSM